MESDRSDLLDKLRLDREREERPPRRLGVSWVAVVGGAVLLVGFGLLMGQVTSDSLKTASASEGADVVRSSGSGTEDSKPQADKDAGEMPSRYKLEASGYVVARRAATVSSKITGKVTELRVEEGMSVEQGQVLGRMEADSAKAEYDLAQSRVAAAQAGVNETRARLKEAQIRLERTKDLASRNLASPAELDAARAEVDSLRAVADTRVAKHRMAQHQEQLARKKLEETYIRAPFSGVVTVKNAQPGEIVSPTSAGGGFTRTGICTLVDMDSLEIEVDVNETYISRVVPGQAVEATLDAYPDWTIPAKVKTVVPTADRKKATIKVRIQFEELDPRILPEMGVKVRFINKDVANSSDRRTG